MSEQPGFKKLHVPGKDFRPNMRDEDRRIDGPNVSPLTQFVQNFGGGKPEWWKGRDVSARADRIAPPRPGGPTSNQEPMTPVNHNGPRTPK